ncbi:MAG: hypothetical protein ACKOWF_08335 [Chloroflexota bacterium]
MAAMNAAERRPGNHAGRAPATALACWLHGGSGFEFANAGLKAFDADAGFVEGELLNRDGGRGD